jgi:ribosomal protein S18 acetylase RimI-like enzyme
LKIEKYNKNKHNTKAVQDLLAMAMGHPTPERIHKLLEEFYTKKGHTLFVAQDKSKIIGIIGIDYTAAPYWWILHITVHPALRMRGIGRGLIDQITKKLSLGSVALETDQDGVGFYRACGFNAVEIKSKWPGVRRYRCIKGHWPESMLEYYNNLTLPQ